ncbi:MAG: glycosyltransferase family 2 protein [Treponema sp.]|nr:glycosyltransferase family 2 protein [Treponema sp.]
MSGLDQSRIPIIIPSYEPNESLAKLIENLVQKDFKSIIVVDDGSGNDYQEIFDSVKNLGATVIQHKSNMGKGAALKTAFKYCLENIEGIVGCVTADSDGQHSIDCIGKCIQALAEHPASLVMGSRDFTLPGIPKASIIGNMNTNKIIRHIYGKDMSDTQTGLRGISKKLMEECLGIKFDRFEFEIRMLTLALDSSVDVVEVPIQTIYDSEKNHATHFRPIKDTVKIYRAIGFWCSIYILLFKK